jgi:hypothetical protein
MSSVLGYTLTGDLTYLAHIHFRKTETTRNHPSKNVLVTQTQVETLHKQQTYNNTQTNLDLWDMASTSNIDILECLQSKALCMIVDTPWYVPNTVIRRDLQTPTVKEEIRRYSSQYSARLSVHPNDLLVNLMVKPNNRRLRRHLPNDLPTTFLV